MYQLKALIWKSFKVRLRSPYSTALDILGPLIFIIFYMLVKIIINQNYDLAVDEQARGMKFFRNLPDQPVDLRRDLTRFTCARILFHSEQSNRASADLVMSAMQNQCGLQLTEVSSRQELIKRLSDSLAARVAYKKVDTNLEGVNSTSGDNCIELKGGTNVTTSIYQTGLIMAEGNSMEMYMTDSAGSSVIQMPYTQGATYNEYKLANSDLNTGTHLLELCIALAYKSLTNNTSSSANTNQSTVQVDISDIKWRFRPYPVSTGIYVVPLSTTVAIMIAYLCTNVATVIRVAEANEYGLHRYQRLAGLPVCLHWLEQLIVIFVQGFFQSLLVTIFLEVPTGNHVYDPITECSMTLRWLMILAYSLATNTHATFLASLFDRSAQALIALCLIGSAYAMLPILLILQWSPYGFTEFSPINWLALLNPAANFQMLCLVLIGVALQTNQPLNWSHLDLRLINGGQSDLSAGQLLGLLLIQPLFFTLLTIIVDQYKYATANTIWGYIFTTVNELLCSNCCCSPNSNRSTEDVKTKSTAPAASKSSLDPNRICCSLRHVSVHGDKILLPYTKGNPLRLKHEQMSAMRAQIGDKTASKTSQYLLSRTKQASAYTPGTSPFLEEPLMIDEAVRQNIVWFETENRLQNLELDFRYNQTTYILGQPDLKELLFSTILGMVALSGGHIIIDGVNYTEANISLARKQIGYLGERNVFYNELSIFENLQFFGSLREPNYKSFDSESLYILNLLHLSSRNNNMPNSLTTRSARKLALAVALVGYTKLLLLTEPTLNLHWRPRCQVHNLLRKYKSIRSIVIDSSDVDEAVAFGDRLVLLKNGLADLNDTPNKLAKRLACGYWLVFEPVEGKGRTVNSESIKALEQLTNSLFQADKLDLDATKRSIYHNITTDDDNLTSNLGSSKEGPGGPKLSPKTKEQKLAMSTERNQDDLHRMIVIVKVQHSEQSTKALCSLLKMFASHQAVQGFKLAHLSYESLEDILVLRMSRAIYPDLPPDLLLSLQHRTQRQQKSTEPSSVSVRKLVSGSTPQSTAKKSIHSAGLGAIIKDRLTSGWELFTTLVALLGALIVIALTIYALQNSFQPDRELQQTVVSKPSNRMNQLTSSSNYLSNRDMRQIQRNNEAKFSSENYNYLEHSSLERVYKYRIGLYSLSSNSSMTFENWQGNRDLMGVINIAESNNKSDPELVADIVHNTKDLAGSIIAFNSKTNEATVIFEPHLPHMLLATMKTFINHNLADRHKISILRVTNQSESEMSTIPAATTTTEQNTTTTTTISTITTAMAASATETNQQDDISVLSDNFASSRDVKMVVDMRREIDRQQQQRQQPQQEQQQQTDSAASSVYTTSRHYFHQPWHETVRGYLNRRLIYGIGFAIAESLANGVIVLAPIRHRNESRLAQVRMSYWFSMALVDMLISLLLIGGYIALFIIFESLHTPGLIVSMFIVFFIYKLASLPLPYMVSIATESPLYGFLFILLIQFSISWNFAIFLRSFIDWTLVADTYLYTIATWLLFGLPITALIESLTVINQVNNIDRRCGDVPAYTKTTNTIDLDGVHRHTMVDDLLDKVRQCLASGKMSIETGVLHGQSLGIIWSIYLILLFGLVGWTFLLLSERFFGIIARRFSSAKTSNDPMKTIIRLPDNAPSLFKWDKERDRLISEYIKCMNELKYVKLMAANCLILRVWLKPMSDQTTLDKRLMNILEPLMGLGHSKNDFQIELRTTLQIFIRIGNESKPCRVDRIHLIELYSKYLESHSDAIAKFAVVDWTRENLYKILLHGHYNTKITTTNLA